MAVVARQSQYGGDRIARDAVAFPDTGSVFFAALAVYGIFNLVVCRSLWLDGGLTRAQKLAQGLLAWAIPIVGGGIVLAMQGQNHSREEMKLLTPFPFYLVGYVDRRFKGASANTDQGHIDPEFHKGP